MNVMLSMIAPLAAGKIHWTQELMNWINGNLANGWVIFGFLAQAVFASRFVVQWIASERAGRSVVPTVFWYLSLLGTAMLTIYAVYRKDPVFIMGQSLNSIIYVRNLMLIYRPRAAQLAVVEAGKPGETRGM